MTEEVNTFYDLNLDSDQNPIDQQEPPTPVTVKKPIKQTTIQQKKFKPPTPTNTVIKPPATPIKPKTPPFSLTKVLLFCITDFKYK
jgi:hypothetical protein